MTRGEGLVCRLLADIRQHVHALGRELEARLAHFRRNSLGTQRGLDDLDRALQGHGALLQGSQQLLLALLVGEELLVMTHTHAHQTLSQLITAKGSAKRQQALGAVGLHESAGSIRGVLHDIIHILHRLGLCLHLDVSPLVHIEVFLELEALPAVGVVADPLLVL